MSGIPGQPVAAAPLRIVVLGCAEIACRHAIPAIANAPGAELTAVASRDAGKAERTAARFGCAAVTGYAAALERDDVDAVYLPLPPALHAEWSERALRAGKHVLAEKPMTTTHADAARLVDLARSRDLVLLENFAFLEHGQHAAVRRLIDDGVLGELRSLTAEFGFPPVATGSIRYQPSLGGGALLDAGVYPIRTAAHYLDEPTVLGAVLRMDQRTGVDLGGSALLASPDGVTASLNFGFDRSYRCAYTLWGSAARITLTRAYSAPATLAPTLVLERQGVVEQHTLPPTDQFAAIVHRFVGLVTDRAERAAAQEAALRQAALVDAVAAAAARSVRSCNDASTVH